MYTSKKKTSDVKRIRIKSEEILQNGRAFLRMWNTPLPFRYVGVLVSASNASLFCYKLRCACKIWVAQSNQNCRVSDSHINRTTQLLHIMCDKMVIHTCETMVTRSCDTRLHVRAKRWLHAHATQWLHACAAQWLKHVRHDSYTHLSSTYL